MRGGQVLGQQVEGHTGGGEADMDRENEREGGKGSQAYHAGKREKVDSGNSNSS